MGFAGMLLFLKNLRVIEFQFEFFTLILCSNSNVLVLKIKSSQEYRVNASVPQGSIFGCRFFLLYINLLLDDVVCSTAVYADDTILQCN